MKNIKLSFTLCHTTCVVLKFLHKYIIFLVFDHICVSKHEKRKMKSFFSSPSSLHYLSLVCTTHFYMCTHLLLKVAETKNTREWERWKSNKIHTRKSFFSLFFYYHIQTNKHHFFLYTLPPPYTSVCTFFLLNKLCLIDQI